MLAPMRRPHLLFPLALAFLSACRETPAPAENPPEPPTLESADELSLAPPFEGFSVIQDAEITWKEETLRWPPTPSIGELQAPEGELFLYAITQQDERKERSTIALTIPQAAQRETLEATTEQLHERRISVLFYPPPSARTPDADSEIELLDELDAPSLRLPGVRIPAAVSALYTARHQAHSLVEICFPSALQAPESRGDAVRIGQRCRHWLLAEGRALELDDADQESTRWYPLHEFGTPSAPSFELDQAGQLARRVEVDVPLPGDRSQRIALRLAWPKSGLTIAPAPWPEEANVAQLQAWAESSAYDDEDSAAQAIARILAVRQWGGGLHAQDEDWFAIEAKALEKIAAIVRKAHNDADAWGYLSRLADALDAAGGGTLPRPSATTTLIPAEEELTELGWRGQGYSLDPALPPRWTSAGDAWALDLHTRRNGTLRCTPNRCTKIRAAHSDEDDATNALAQAVTAPTLYHPTRPIAVQAFGGQSGAPAIALTSTAAPHHCDPIAACELATSCETTRASSLDAPSRRAGRVLAWVALRSDVSAAGLGDRCDAARTGSEITPITWLDATRLVVSDEAGLKIVDTQTQAISPVAFDGVEEWVRTTGGFNAQGERYLLRTRSRDAALWIRAVDGSERLVPIVGIRAPEVPASAHSWAIPTPDDSKFAIVWGGVFVGVWPTQAIPSDDTEIDSPGDGEVP